MFKWLFGENEDDRLAREVDEYLNRTPITVYFEIHPYESRGFIIVRKYSGFLRGVSERLYEDIPTLPFKLEDKLPDRFLPCSSFGKNRHLRIFPTKLAAEKALKPYLEKAKTDNERKLKEHRDEVRHKENNPVATYIP